MTTPTIGLDELLEGQARADVTANESFARLDALLASIVTSELSTPPAEPTQGETYLIGASPTGAWDGREGQITFYSSGWKFFTPPNGWRMFNAATSKLMVRVGGAWSEVQVTGSSGLLALLGALRLSVEDSITASIVVTQGSQTLSATKALHIVTTVANTNDVVTLPEGVAGDVHIVQNAGANTMGIYPPVDAAIGSGDVDGAVTLTSKAMAIFVYASATLIFRV